MSQNWYHSQIRVRNPLLVDRTTWIAVTSIIAIAGGELLIAVSLPIAGTLLHGLILVVLLGSGLVVTRQTQELLAALALAPLLRLLSLTVPITYLPPALWPVLVSITLLVAAGWMIRIFQLTRAELGVRRGPWKGQLLLIACSTIIGWMLSWILPAPIWSSEVPILAALVLGFAGVTEELLFRGIVQASIVRVFGNQGWLWSAFLSTTLYISTQSFIMIALALLMSLSFGRIVQHSGTVWGVMLSHGIINIILALWLF
jgi:hypothetical protein